MDELECTASLKAGEGHAFLKILLAEGLVERTGSCTWTITQPGQTLSSATAAKRVTRATAEKALQEFSRRVERVNREPYFLGKVTRVVLFGSMLTPEVERVSDVDLAVEIVPKEADFNRASSKNYDRVEELAAAGTHIPEGCRDRSLLAFGGIPILEGTDPCHSLGGLLGGKELRFGCTPLFSDWKAGTDRDAKSA